MLGKKDLGKKSTKKGKTNIFVYKYENKDRIFRILYYKSIDYYAEGRGGYLPIVK